MRALGIDPGTGNFDFCCIEDDVDRVVLDETLPSSMVAHETDKVIRLIKNASPDFIVGPSGYGIAFKHVSQLTDEDFALTTLEKKSDTGIAVLSGVRRLLRMIKNEGMNAYTVPGVIQLPTVPLHRKINKIDMGTADKTCVTAYAIWDQARKYNIRYDATRLICLELGLGYNAVIAVENGKIIDGIGGTFFPGPGYLAFGALDGELAYLLGSFSKKLLFTGGASFYATGSETSLEDFRQHLWSSHSLSWRAFLEGIVKAVAAVETSIDSKPVEVIITGRLSRIPELREDIIAFIQKKLGLKCRRPEYVFTTKAKEVAMGAAIIANGIGGGKYYDLVETMEIKKSSGTVLDYVKVAGLEKIVTSLRSD